MNETRLIATSRAITIEGITIQLKYNTKTKCVDISSDKIGIVHDTAYSEDTENKTKCITLHLGESLFVLEYGEETVLIDIDNKILEDINSYIDSGNIKARVRSHKDCY